MTTTEMLQEHKTKVLLVDDESGVIQVVAEVLEMTGKFEVHGALSVAEGFKMLNKEEFDVIVSDYRMPEKDGLQFLKELKEKGGDKPFVMFTGKGKEQVASEALRLGAFGFLSKNGQPETVYAKLTSTIQEAIHSRAEKQNRGEVSNVKMRKG